VPCPHSYYIIHTHAGVPDITIGYLELGPTDTLCYSYPIIALYYYLHTGVDTPLIIFPIWLGQFPDGPQLLLLLHYGLHRFIYIATLHTFCYIITVQTPPTQYPILTHTLHYLWDFIVDLIPI